MARGWESKDVESQMEDAQQARRNAGSPRTPEQLQRERERDSLQLHRSRVLADIDAAKNPRYRELLQRSLAFLDEKIAGLDSAGG